MLNYKFIIEISSMLKKLLPSLFIFVLAACGGNSENASNNNTAASTSISTSTNSVQWFQDTLDNPVEKVGFGSADNIIKSVKLNPVNTVKSTDEKGEPKTIYKFSDSSITAQLEYSSNVVIIAWVQATDDQSSLQKSQESLKVAYLLARAVVGNEGADAIRRISNGGNYRNEVIADYPVNGQCSSSMCLLKFNLTAK